jgi:predicted nucleic acid-binding protein
VRLFLDANVVFSAVRNPEGIAAGLVDLAAKGLCELLVSPHCLEEARRNLALKHPEKVHQLRLMGIIHLVEERTPENSEWACQLGLPLKDAPILGAAVQARADLLVTGDRAHFAKLYGKMFRGVDVVPPSEALTRILANPRSRPPRPRYNN